VKADWAFASYKLNNNVSVRAGRVRLPLYLASEYVEVGYAYPWVRPPAEVYRVAPVNAITGVTVPLKANLGGMDLVVQPYAGSLEFTTQSRGLTAQIKGENLVGASIDLSNDTLRLHASYFTDKTTANTKVPVPLCDPTIPYPTPGSCPPGLGVITGDLDVTVLDTSAFEAWDVGMTMDWRNIMLMTEYVRGNFGTVLDDEFGWYATLGYKMGNFLPYLTYAERYSDKVTDDPSTIANEPFLLGGSIQSQNTIALGLRYNIGNASALKFEVLQGSAQDDTCGLIDGGASGCSGNFPVNGSYNMYSVAYDVVF
jgi:predicted porin